MLVACDVEVSVADGVRILGPVSLEVAPGSLVALMGTSGSGKSTLLHVLAGIAEPTAGRAAWADQPTSESVQALGFVPQRESVHDRLTTREALHYAACLRLGAEGEIEKRVETVLDELDLIEQAETLIANLSGGERRRAACGLELVGDPPVLLLDEPTSGLDTVLERRLMELFRRLADQGRAVLVATHATASLDLCDEVVVLESGLVAYSGGPAQARTRLAAMAHDPRQPSGAGSPDVVSGDAEGEVATKTVVTEERSAPASALASAPASARASGRAEFIPATASRSFGFELRVLAARYLRTLTRDRRTLVLLLGQAPVIGLLIALVFHAGAPSTSDSPLDAIVLVFLIMTASIWLGVSSACREVVKERGLVEREFDVGVRLDAYVLAKALVLFALNFVQVFWLTIVVVGLRPLGAGPGGVAELLVIAVLTAWASAAMGLAVSCAARSVDQAAGAVPLLLMPQLLLAGGLIPLAQMPGAVAALANVIYARWSFAGLASAVGIGGRLSQYSDAGALGFSTGFFSLKPGTAIVILSAFTLVELLVAVRFLMSRPAVNP